MTTKDTVLIALFAALIVVLSLLPPIPLGIVPAPITLQTLGVMLAGAMLGPWRGMLACLLYMALWIIGLPVLPGGRGGLGVLAGPTGGFLLGMVAGAFVTGLVARGVVSSATSRTGQLAGHFAACVLGGIAMVYIVGIPWLAMVTGMGFQKAMLGSLAFLPGDLLKAAATAIIAYRVRRAWPMPLR